MSISSSQSLKSAKLQKHLQMLRQNPSSRSNSKGDRPIQPPKNRVSGFDVQQELNRVEEIILDSPRIPLTRLTLVEEDKLLNHLDFVRINLPDAFEKALDIIGQKHEILLEAEDYAQNIVEAAQKRAAQILDETGIIQQAEFEASQIRQQVQQECEAIQRKTIAEVEQMRVTTQKELQQLHQQTLAECAEIQNGADEYAEAVLSRIERQLSDMLRVVRNGCQQLHNNSPSQSSPNKKLPGSPGSR